MCTQINESNSSSIWETNIQVLMSLAKYRKSHYYYSDGKDILVHIKHCPEKMTWLCFSREVLMLALLLCTLSVNCFNIYLFRYAPREGWIGNQTSLLFYLSFFRHNDSLRCRKVCHWEFPQELWAISDRSAKEWPTVK